MFRAMDWEKANRIDRANGLALPKQPRLRKNSKMYVITRLKQLIDIAESEQWQIISEPHKNQILHEIEMTISGSSKKQGGFLETAIAKKAISLVSKFSWIFRQTGGRENGRALISCVPSY